MKTPKQKQLQAEPATTYPDGSVSDAAEHMYMLDNPAANRIADEMARQAMVACGFTEEDLKGLIMSGPEDMEQFI